MLTDLYGLSFNGSQSISNKSLESISNLAGLVELSLRGTTITQAPPLYRMSRLVELDLSFTGVAKMHLPSLPRLENLDLRGTCLLSDEMLASLPSLPKLRNLDIAANPAGDSTITDKGLSHLTPNKFPNLQVIYLYDAKVTDSAITRLKNDFPGLAVYH